MFYGRPNPGGGHTIAGITAAGLFGGFQGSFGVGMYAEGHRALYANMLDLHRELAAPEVVDVFADDPVHVGVHYLAEGVAGQPAVADEGITVAKVGQAELVGAPGILVLKGAKAQGI